MSKRLASCVSVLLSIGSVLLIVPSPDGALGKNTVYFSVAMLVVSLCLGIYLYRARRT